MGRREQYTAVLDQQLRLLRLIKRLSYSQIAEIMGLSKGQVIGRASRLGLPGQETRRSVTDIPVIGGCLFPMWPNGTKPDHRYCGAKKRIGSSYCDEHEALTRLPVSAFKEMRDPANYTLRRGGLS